MRSFTLSQWGVPATVALGLGGAFFIWASTTTGSSPVRPLVLAGGVGLCAIATVSAVLAAIARVRHDAVDRSLKRYACPRCDYSPKPEDLEAGNAFSCPACGRPIYPEG